MTTEKQTRRAAMKAIGLATAGLALSRAVDAPAQALRGLLVIAGASALEPLAEDEFYWHQLVGCTVETDAGERVGTVREIWETGAHDVMVVRDDAGRQNLIPTARELTLEIDLEGRRIVVRTLPGLLALGAEPEPDTEPEV